MMKTIDYAAVVSTRPRRSLRCRWPFAHCQSFSHHRYPVSPLWIFLLLALSHGFQFSHAETARCLGENVVLAEWSLAPGVTSCSATSAPFLSLMLKVGIMVLEVMWRYTAAPARRLGSAWMYGRGPSRKFPVCTSLTRASCPSFAGPVTEVNPVYILRT